jgi:hypothetical protein
VARDAKARNAAAKTKTPAPAQDVPVEAGRSRKPAVRLVLAEADAG